MAPPKLVVVGTGAMACLFGARLSAAGIPVVMLGTWVDGLAALRRDGIRVLDSGGGEQVYPVQVVSDPIECTGVRFALVLVKSWQTERVARQLADCLPEDGLALTLQNGIGNHELLVDHLGAGRAAVGSTTLGANLAAPGTVRPAGEGAVILGEHPRIEPLAQLLQEAGFTVERVADIRAVQWGKLVINAAINPLTAILRVPNGELLERPDARSLMACAAREAAGVATAQGIPLPYSDPVEMVEAIARRTAKNVSSMLQDVCRNAPTEVDMINGAIVKAGEQAGLETPVNWSLWLLVRALRGSSS